MANRTVTFSFSRNNAPGDITQSLKLAITDSSGATVVTFNPAVTATSQATTLPVANGYVATLTAFSGAFGTGLPCLHPAVVAFDVPPATVAVPGDPTLDVPVVS